MKFCCSSVCHIIRVLVGDLSGGEWQGLAISHAMHYHAALTLLDEPTTALAVKEVGKILIFSVQFRRKGVRPCLFPTISIM